MDFRKIVKIVSKDLGYQARTSEIVRSISGGEVDPRTCSPKFMAGLVMIVVTLLCSMILKIKIVNFPSGWITGETGGMLNRFALTLYNILREGFMTGPWINRGVYLVGTLSTAHAIMSATKKVSKLVTEPRIMRRICIAWHDLVAEHPDDKKIAASMTAVVQPLIGQLSPYQVSHFHINHANSNNTATSTP